MSNPPPPSTNTQPAGNIIVKSIGEVKSLATLPKAVPDYMIMNRDVQRSLDSTRNIVKVTPTGASSFSDTSTQTILITIPNDCLYDLRHATLNFQASASITSPTALVNPIYTLTQSTGAAGAGTVVIGYRNPITGLWGYTGSLAYNTTATNLKAAMEALPNWISGATATFSSAFSGATAPTLTISLSGASTQAQLTAHSATDVVVIAASGFTSGGTAQYVTVTLTTAQTTPGYVAFSSNIATIFTRVRVMCGATQVLNIPNYGLLCAIYEQMVRSQISDQVNNPQSIDYLLGIDSLYQRIDWAAGNGRYYKMPLAFFGSVFTQDGSKLFPAHVFKGASWQIYLDIDTPNNILESTATSGIHWSVSNVQLVMSSISDPQLQARYESESVGGLYLPFENWTNTSLTYSGTAQDVQLGQHYSAVSRVISVFRTQSGLQSATTLDKFSTYQTANINSTQFQIGAYQIPLQPDTQSTDYLYNLLKIIDKYHAQPRYMENPIAARIATNKAIYCFDLAKYSAETPIIDGLNLNTNASNMLLKFLSSSAPSTMTFDAFIGYTSVLKYQNGMVTILN